MTVHVIDGARCRRRVTVGVLLSARYRHDSVVLPCYACELVGAQLPGSTEPTWRVVSPLSARYGWRAFGAYSRSNAVLVTGIAIIFYATTCVRARRLVFARAGCRDLLSHWRCSWLQHWFPCVFALNMIVSSPCILSGNDPGALRASSCVRARRVFAFVAAGCGECLHCANIMPRTVQNLWAP